MTKILIFIFSLFSGMAILAQRPGVNPLFISDMRTDQLFGNVHSVTEQTFKINYERRVIEQGEFVGATTRTYNFDGSISTETTNDSSGELLTRTIYQYANGVKSVSTTYGANGERTLQTLYAFTADSVCARMRCTDAIGVTFCTSEVSHKTNWAMIEESFADGENVATEYFYNSALRLTKIIANSNGNRRETQFTLDNSGHPRRAVTKGNGRKITVDYVYKLDELGNWTERVASVNGTPSEITFRTIEYY